MGRANFVSLIGGNYMKQKAVRLGLNESPFAPHNTVVAAAQKACREANRYPEWDAGMLRAALAHYWGVSQDWVVAGSGSAGIIQQAMIASGQGEIAFGWPSFDAFPAIAEGLRMRVHKVRLKNNVCDLAALKRALTPKTTVVIICTPNTPTGGILHHDELAKFLQTLSPKVVAIIDEAYGEFVRDDHAVQALELVRQFPNVVMTRTFSKAHGMAGYRVGYGIAQPELAKKIAAAGIPFSVPLPAQAAALAALKNQKIAKERVEMIIAERARLATMLRQFGAEVVEGHGNFVWLPIGELAQQVAHKLAQHNVLVKALMPLGIRITVGTSEETDRLRDAWMKAKPLSE